MLTTHTCFVTLAALQTVAHASTSNDAAVLRLELAQLYADVEEWGMARDEAQQALEALQQAPCTEAAPWHPAAHCCLVLGRVHAKLQAPEHARSALQQGLALQSAYVAGLQGDARCRASTNAAVLCCALADVSAQQDARDAWQRALTFDGTHAPALLQLARADLHDDPAACRARCTQLLQVDPDDHDGHVLMVDVLVMQQRTEEALEHLQALMKHNNGNYTLTARYVTMLQRAGSVPDLELPADGPAGAHFCRGLLARGAGDRPGAIRAFTAAMHDPAWHSRAADALLQVLLGSCLALLWEGAPTWNKAAQPEELQRAKEVAESLEDRVQGAAWQVLVGLCAGAAAERVLGNVLGLLFDHQHHPGLLLATAAAHLAAGQGQQVGRARCMCVLMHTHVCRRSRCCSRCGRCLCSRMLPGSCRQAAWRWRTCTCRWGGPTTPRCVKRCVCTYTWAYMQAVATRCLQQDKACAQAWAALAAAHKQQGRKEVCCDRDGHINVS